MRNRNLMIAVAIAGAAVLGVGAGPASAYSGPLYHGNDYAQTMYINDDVIEVCDMEADGNGVYAEYYLNTGAFKSVNDGNGSAAGCGRNDWQSSPYWITHYRVCERSVSCSGWVYTDGLGGSSLPRGASR